MTDEQLSATILGVQHRARARVPQGRLGLDGVEAADLMPLVHARDAVQAKVAAIGTVNPRPPGLVNSAMQALKRATARALDWHVREQVEFNRAALACVEASIVAMSGMSRSLAALTAHISSDRAAHTAYQSAEETHRQELHQHVQELRLLCARQEQALKDAGNTSSQELQQRAQELEALYTRQEETRRKELQELHALRTRQEEALRESRAQFSTQVDDLRREHGGRIETLRHEHGGQMEALRREYTEQVEALRREYGAQVEALRTEYGALVEQFGLQQAARFDEWRTDQGRVLEEQAAANGIQVSRTVSSLDASYRETLARQEETFHELARTQHQDFSQALERNSMDVQKRVWDVLAKSREDLEGLIHRELRLLRQRASLPAPASASGSQAAFDLDWIQFAERFRGLDERIRGQQQRYVRIFEGTQGDVLDIGCGRGEFLEALRHAGLAALGIDSNPECVELCKSKGLRATCTDLFNYLEAQADGSLAGAYCAQVIEHLAPPQVARLVRLLGAKMRAGAWVAVETPNPECLAIFATYFYADPTHTRPVPASLLRFYLEEAGFGSIAVEYVNPAAESIPAVKEFPATVEGALFGGLDYAIFARKLPLASSE